MKKETKDQKRQELIEEIKEILQQTYMENNEYEDLSGTGAISMIVEQLAFYLERTEDNFDKEAFIESIDTYR